LGIVPTKESGGDEVGRKKTSSSDSSKYQKVFGVRCDREMAKKLKILAVKRETQVYRLIEEAISDLLKKYKEV